MHEPASPECGLHPPPARPDPRGPLARAPRRAGRIARGWRRGAALALAGAFVCVAGASAGPLHITGMTFLASRGTTSEIVLHSDTAIYHPDTDIADLEAVKAVVTDDKKGESFEMTCDRARLNVDTNDFVAEGNVQGVTADGQHYAASRVEYDHASGVLRSDQRVVMVDDTGSFEGDGFRYHVRDRRFNLLGNVRVVQKP
jgi:LPS export ABC transporter protein LptC